MLVLEAGKVCPYSARCPYHTSHNQCQGAMSSRNVEFKCSYVNNGVIESGGVRLPQDKTGQMEILID